MIQYNRTHSIDFFGKLENVGTISTMNTWRDLHLIPTKKPYIAYPEMQLNLVSIPVSNKVLDLTNYLRPNDPVSSARKGEWEFIVETDLWGSVENAYNYLLANLHGRRLYCELQDDPGKVYRGRFMVTSFDSTSTYPMVRISYTVSPEYKTIVTAQADGSETYIYDAVIEEEEIQPEAEWQDAELYDL